MFRKNISLGYMLHILLKFRKLQSQYSCKVFFPFKERNKCDESCCILPFSFNCPCSQWILIYLEKESGILSFIFSYSWIFEGRNQQWKFVWSRRLWIGQSLPQGLCGIQRIVHGVVIYWSSLRASLFNILWSMRTELCQSIVHSFCTQFTFDIDWFQLKREISRTITICLH